MSSRARRLARVAEVARFAWGRASDAPRSAEPLPSDAETRPAQQPRVAEIERQAFTTGYSQGEKAGLEAGAKRAEAMLRRVSETLESLAALRTDIIRQTEHQMLQLALAIAKRILRREVALDPDLTVAMARVALDRLGDTPTAKIRLHPEDYALTVERSDRPLASKHVSVVADDSVSRGSCLIESDFGFVEAGVEAQFEEIAKALVDEAEPVGVTQDDVVARTLADGVEPVAKGERA